jgi:hypothetical protein
MSDLGDMMKYLVSVIILLLSIPQIAEALNIYVDLRDGDDANSGFS